MGLTPQDNYSVFLQNIDDESCYYQSILWVDDDGYFDEDDGRKSLREIIELILAEKPDYIALHDLRYVRQDIHVKQVEGE